MKQIICYGHPSPYTILGNFDLKDVILYTVPEINKSLIQLVLFYGCIVGRICI